MSHPEPVIVSDVTIAPKRRGAPPIQWRSWRWWGNGLARSLLASALCAVAIGVPALRYRVVGDAIVGEHCLPFRLYLVDLEDHAVGRGDYVVFRSRGTEPFYADGTRMLKRIVGVAGDRVLVNSQGVFVNGVFVGTLLHAERGGRLWKLGQGVEHFVRDESVPAGLWWVMGTHPRSFDSRYWGYIATDQIMGRARPIW
jgi:conjugal transfer pilin signal peptidase TrbI